LDYININTRYFQQPFLFSWHVTIETLTIVLQRLSSGQCKALWQWPLPCKLSYYYYYWLLLVIVDKRWRRVRRWTDTWRPAQCSNKLAVVNVSVAIRVEPVSNGFHLQTTCWKAFTTQHKTTAITSKWPSNTEHCLLGLANPFVSKLDINFTQAQHTLPCPHCQVLPPGEFNGTTAEQLLVYCESFVKT